MFLGFGHRLRPKPNGSGTREKIRAQIRGEESTSMASLVCSILGLFNGSARKRNLYLWYYALPRILHGRINSSGKQWHGETDDITRNDPIAIPDSLPPAVSLESAAPQGAAPDIAATQHQGTFTYLMQHVAQQHQVNERLQAHSLLP